MSDLSLPHHPPRAQATPASLAAHSVSERLQDCERALQRVARLATQLSAGDCPLEPAAEWLLDNHYFVQAQLRQTREQLGAAASRRGRDAALPPGNGPSLTLALMRELVQRTDGVVSQGVVERFVAAHQERSRDPLRLSELWALPLMLRVALFEHVHPVIDGVGARLAHTADASRAISRLSQLARTQREGMAQALRQEIRADQLDASAWVVEAQRRLRTSPWGMQEIQAWLGVQLARRGGSVASSLHAEQAAHAQAQARARDCVRSLIEMERADWLESVEKLSLVDHVLQRDPAEVYALMDAATRNRYRDAVCELAQRARLPECAVAWRAIARAAAPAPGSAAGLPLNHVGHWLISAGRAGLERELLARVPAHERAWRAVQRFASWYYLLPIVAIALAVTLWSLPVLAGSAALHAAVLVAAVFLAASQLSVALINWAASLDVTPHQMARLDLSGGVPSALRTLVVVPSLLGSADEVAQLLSALEVRYMGNRDAHIHFALLTDFTDAPARTMPGDAALLATAQRGIEALNARHAPGEVPRFCLLHRERVWSPGEGVWMGWERKRGKLIALNRFLRAHSQADIELRVGDAATLRGVAFVITLDADTQLPPETARRLIATLAHPLNRPVVDPAQRRVVAGYGVLQPRVSVGASRKGASRLARLHTDELALDPYTGLVSDVYQDLFGEASFIGKGIYDVDAFVASVDARFPDNRILSHDLLEGSYARTGLVSDVELLEHHPDRYAADMSRRERWMRGDWQVARWVLPRVPNAQGTLEPNVLSFHHRWKLLDNLRRSLVPVALLFLLLQGWLLDAWPLYWSALVLAVVFVPPLVAHAGPLVRRKSPGLWALETRLAARAMGRSLLQAAVPLVMLPSEAGLAVAAIARSTWRLLGSRKLRLQWTPASSVACRSSQHGLVALCRQMWPAPVVAAATWAALEGASTAALVSATPFLLLWLASPLWAWWLSQPAKKPLPERLTADQSAWLGAAARRTWHFFDRFVTPEDNHLPPDNVQDGSHPQIAHRTSPTNIGMYLTSAQSAADFGYLTATELAQRLGATLTTLERLERCQGHFLNWYDTRSLAAMQPRYASTVDSGNLLASLIVLARGLEDHGQHERLLPAQAWRGLADTWRVCRQLGKAASTSAAALPRRVTDALAGVHAELAAAPASTATLTCQAQALRRLAGHLDDALRALADGPVPGCPDAAWPAGPSHDGVAPPEESLCGWLGRLRAECGAWLGQLDGRAPWLAWDEAAPAPWQPLLAQLQANPTLEQAHAILRRALALPCPQALVQVAAMRQQLCRGADALAAEIHSARTLAGRCRQLAQADFRFLFDPRQKLLAVGYNLDREACDESYYDFLASEARLASFVAIAMGQLTQAHWLALSRLLTPAGESVALASWSGTMFEYLMPLIFMPAYSNTLLARSCKNAVALQMSEGRRRGIPWGVSESAYNATDAQGVYQYRAFGMPQLGLKRGLGKDQVVAPYASALALMLRPNDACRNLQQLARLGAGGQYGFYEALDFTPSRLPRASRVEVVCTFMAHHQGMTLAALSAVLNDAPLQRRFQREPMCRAHELLLQEKVPAASRIDAIQLTAPQLRPDKQASAQQRPERLNEAALAP